METADGFGSFEELAALVDKRQGVVTVTMRDLRNVLGRDRLASLIREELSEELGRVGLGHLPRDLPNDQKALARIYRRGGAVEKLIEAVLSNDDESDKILRDRAGDDAADKIQKIRELICG
jgi:hypothetical protein